MKKEVKTRLKPKGTITTLVKGRVGKVARAWANITTEALKMNGIKGKC